MANRGHFSSLVIDQSNKPKKTMGTNKTDNMNQNEFNRLVLEKLNRVETALCGDEAAGITGVVKKVIRHEKKLAWIERMVWGIGGAVTLLSILWAVFSEFHE